MNSYILLLKTLLLSTSQRNIYRHTQDKRKRRRIVGNAIAIAFLYVCLVAYCIALCVGYATLGIIDSAPVMCALTISVLAFVFTIFKTNGYLFGFKEYDMLMSLPFEAQTVAGCKFLYMYVKSLPWYASISLATMAGYGFFARPPVVAYLAWIVLSLFLPVIPMLGAAFLGFIIARISAGFKKTNLVQIVLTFAFVIFCFCLRFIVEGIFRDDEVQATLQQASEITANAGRVYMPAGWFSNAITKGNVLDVFLLVGVSTLLFAVVFRIVGHSYGRINSAIASHAAKRNFSMTAQKQRSAVRAVAFKELKRMTGSTVYMVNGAMGEVLAVLLGVVTLVVGFDNIIAAATHDAPFDPSILQPAIPFIIYFLVGMVATTVCSPSLEGKNYWIVQSLPLEKKTLHQGKMLFNMVLSVPAMAFSTLCLCVSANVSPLHTVLYLLLGLALCAFSTAWGCVCGIRHMRLDWENEVEVVKQGAAVTVYLLPNMFVSMGLVVLMVILGMYVDHALLAIAMTAIASALAALSYRGVMALSK